MPVALRRVHHHRDREAQDGVGARLPGDLITLALILVTIIVLKVAVAFADFYGSFGAQLPLPPGRLWRFPNSAFAAPATAFRRQRGRRDRRVRQPTAGPVRPSAARPADARERGQEVRDLADGPDAGDAVRWRPAARQRARHAAKSVGNSMAAQLAWSARVREGESFAAALEARHLPRGRGEDGGGRQSTGALQDMLNTVADFYDEEIATTMDRSQTLVEPVLLAAGHHRQPAAGALHAVVPACSVLAG
jgi:hypothetical protein